MMTSIDSVGHYDRFLYMGRSLDHVKYQIHSFIFLKIFGNVINVDEEQKFVEFSHVD